MEDVIEKLAQIDVVTENDIKYFSYGFEIKISHEFYVFIYENLFLEPL